jgi:phosphoserine phosphatase RsbU/P
LVCYTDGLVELENKEGEAFEVERLIDIIHNNYHLSMVELDELIFKELDNFRKDTPYLDDSCRFL